MVVGVGTDIVQVDRVGKLIEKESAWERVYAPEERAYIVAKGAGRVETAAGMFAAKEAVSKALGTGLRGFGLRDIVVLHDAMGQPGVRLENGARAQLQALGGTRICVSISHEHSMAVAFVVIETG